MDVHKFRSCFCWNLLIPPLDSWLAGCRRKSWSLCPHSVTVVSITLAEGQCLTFWSVSVIKHPDKDNSSHYLHSQKQRRRDECLLVLSFSLLFMHSRVQPMKWLHPHTGWAFLPQLTQWRQSPQHDHKPTWSRQFLIKSFSRSFQVVSIRLTIKANQLARSLSFSVSLSHSGFLELLVLTPPPLRRGQPSQSVRLYTLEQK